MAVIVHFKTAHFSVQFYGSTIIERLSGDYQSAERHFYEALAMVARQNLEFDAVTFRTNLTLLALDLEKWSEAERMAIDALKSSERFERQELVVANATYLAKSLARQGRKAEGLPYAQRAVAIFTKLRSPHLAWAQDVLKECEA